VSKVREFEKALLEHIDSAAPEIYATSGRRRSCSPTREEAARHHRGFQGTFAA